MLYLVTNKPKQEKRNRQNAFSHFLSLVSPFSLLHAFKTEGTGGSENKDHSGIVLTLSEVYENKKLF